MKNKFVFFYTETHLTRISQKAFLAGHLFRNTVLANEKVFLILGPQIHLTKLVKFEDQAMRYRFQIYEAVIIFIQRV